MHKSELDEEKGNVSTGCGSIYCVKNRESNDSLETCLPCPIVASEVPTQAGLKRMNMVRATIGDTISTELTPL